MNSDNEQFMQRAIDLSLESVQNGGGPFGAVIVKNNEVIAASSNSVTLDNDPTAHAEVNAIRSACKKLATFDLSDCTIYTSCEPCPMCLSAIYWAHINTIYYANTKEDAAAIDFDDSFIYDEIKTAIKKRSIPTYKMMSEQAISAFQAWEKNNNKVNY